jgi:hypothetical protein
MEQHWLKHDGARGAAIATFSIPALALESVRALSWTAIFTTVARVPLPKVDT